MKQLLIIGLILISFSCSTNEEKLSENQTLSAIFSQTETQNLQLLFDFFNSSICQRKETQDISICYQDFFQRMEESLETGDMQLNIPFDQQLQVYNQLSDSIISEIWSLEAIRVDGNNLQDTFKTIQINLNGKYFEFLKETAKDDKLAKDYCEALVNAGDITPTLVNSILAYYNDYNTQDIRVKFIIAIHYLTLNDIFERKEKINKTVANKV